MALFHQAQSQRVPPHMLAAIGSAGAGKTVYLGMLTDMLSHPTQPVQLLARGAYSISLQQQTVGALSRCQFPAKTPNEPDRWKWAHCQLLRKKQRPLELILPDVAGESLMEEVEHPNTFPILGKFLAKCAGVMLLVDAARVAHGESEEDFSTMKLISYLCELQQDPKSGWGTRPVAIVFTKADQCEHCFDDPQQFASRHTPGVVQQCGERLRRHRFFASGVAGACGFHSDRYGGRVHAPLRIEPRGLVEPFLWLVQELGV